MSQPEQFKGEGCLVHRAHPSHRAGRRAGAAACCASAASAALLPRRQPIVAGRVDKPGSRQKALPLAGLIQLLHRLQGKQGQGPHRCSKLLMLWGAEVTLHDPLGEGSLRTEHQLVIGCMPASPAGWGPPTPHNIPAHLGAALADRQHLQRLLHSLADLWVGSNAGAGSQELLQLPAAGVAASLSVCECGGQASLTD